MTEVAIDLPSDALNYADARLDRSGGGECEPSTGKAWLAVASVALGAFAIVTSEFLPVGLLPAVAADLSVSHGTAGLMVTMPGVTAAVAAPGVTVLAGRMDRRMLVWALTLVLAAASLLSAAAPNFGTLLVGRVLLGVSLGGFWSIAASLAGRLVPARHAGRALSVILAGISFATIVGVPVGVLVSSYLGWRATFGAVAVLAFAVVAVQVAVLPSLPATHALTFRSIARSLKIRATRVGFLVGLSVITGHFGAYTYVAPFLEHDAGVSPTVVGPILLAYGVAGLAGNFLAGMTIGRNLRLTLAITVALLGGSALLMPVLGRTQIGATGLLVLWGLAFGALPMCMQTWVFRSAPEAPEGASALLVTVFQVCIASGAAAGGVVVDTAGTPAVMVVGGALAASALVTLWWGGPAPVDTGTSAAPAAH